jgi:5-methylcytosine-specific restriction endonuclease McrA
MAYEQERNPRRREFTCPCGKTFTRVKGQGVGKYCSRDCAAAGRVRPESEHTRGKGWAATAEGVRVRDGRLCVRCGAPELPKRRHAVDHIVPWVLVKHRPDIANDPSNLATLCHPCHGVKTAITEPRLLRGDFLALREFYGDEVMATAKAALLAMDVSHG